jgi:site-specific DNA-methyltransferase (adenine-specific)
MSVHPDYQQFLDGRVTLYCGDCLDVLDALPENSVDAVVTDPPYHLTSIVKRFGGDGAAEAKEGATGAFKRAAAGFMGKQWDGGDIAFRVETWAKVLRVLKPGGYLLAFASSRGFGRMSVAIEDAGFINHPLIAWVFGSGFPKATRIKAAGYDDFRYGGQALKPAIEPVYMGQKPFEKGLSGTENILKWGVGALNIGGCRVGDEERSVEVRDISRMHGGSYANQDSRQQAEVVGVSNVSGRWPANIIHDGSDEVLATFPDGLTSGTGAVKRASADGYQANAFGQESRPAGTPMISHGDSGSAARFFYSAKADGEDRIGSKHPTVKPLDLIQYLCQLVTPPGGTVLDLFAGTGTTGEAAWREGFNAVLIEREPEYQADIARRMDLAVKPTKRAAVAKSKNNLLGGEGTPLFGGSAPDLGGGATGLRTLPRSGRTIGPVGLRK